MEKIEFQTEDGIQEFYVEEQTRINGFNYLLVSDSVTEQEAEAYILKDVSEPESQEACYVMVEDEQELEAVMRIFEQSMDCLLYTSPSPRDRG